MIALDGPLVVVIGATGQQGGSVVKALIASKQPYRIRGLTRDVTSDASQQLVARGIEMITADITDADALAKAFAGQPRAVFAVTDFWQACQTDTEQKEIAVGKGIVDAAKSAAVDLFIFSGVLSMAAITGGKYVHVDHFDGKAEIADYALARFGPGHFKNVMAGAFMQNYLGMLSPQQKGDSYVYAYPTRVDGRFGLIDIVEDYGIFVAAAIEHHEELGVELFAVSDEPTFAEIGNVVGRATGKSVETVSVSFEEYQAALGPTPDHIKRDLTEMFAAIGEFGIFGSAALTKGHEYLSRKPKTFADWAQTAKFPFA